MNTNPIQIYFDLKEIDCNLEKAQQTITAMTVDNPKLTETAKLVVSARNYVIEAREKLEQVLSINQEN